MEDAFPAFAELAPAPNVATLVEAVVLAVSDPLQPVPGAATVQVYVKASPAEGGVSTEGPLAGLKSEVTFKVSVPVPVDCVVRILYVRLVVPVYGLNIVPAAARVVVVVVTCSAASALTVTDNVVVPVPANCAYAGQLITAAVSAIKYLRFVIFFTLFVLKSSIQSLRRPSQSCGFPTVLSVY